MNVAILWLISEKGEILIAKRASRMKSDAGVWGPSVSGVIEDNETALEAVIREAEEELAITPTTLSPILLHEEMYDHSDGKGREFSIFYAKVTKEIIDTLILEPNEVAQVKWITFQQLQRMLREEPDTVIIASATDLWTSIFKYLQPITSYRYSNI